MDQVFMEELLFMEKPELEDTDLALMEQEDKDLEVNAEDLKHLQKDSSTIQGKQVDLEQVVLTLLLMEVDSSGALLEEALKVILSKEERLGK
jgi:hypothetical protein